MFHLFPSLFGYPASFPYFRFPPWTRGRRLWQVMMSGRAGSAAESGAGCCARTRRAAELLPRGGLVITARAANRVLQRGLQKLSLFPTPSQSASPSCPCFSFFFFLFFWTVFAWGDFLSPSSVRNCFLLQKIYCLLAIPVDLGSLGH